MLHPRCSSDSGDSITSASGRNDGYGSGSPQTAGKQTIRLDDNYKHTFIMLVYCFKQRVQNIQRPLNSARGQVFGCHGDVPGGGKKYDTLLRVILRLFMITPALEYKQCGALCNSCHARMLADRLGSA